MNKRILFFLLLMVAFMRPAIAQQKVIIEAKEYDRLKSESRLSGNEQIKTNSHTIGNRRVFPSTPTVASTGCDYWIPRDLTWSIARFNCTTATPPDYRNDDCSTGVIDLPFTFCFYGDTINQVYLNNNGNISIGAPYTTFTGAAFPNNNFVMIAPFWSDVDTRGTGSDLVYFKMTPTHMIVQWDHVGYYNTHFDKKNTFQLIITNGSDPIIRDGKNVSFCYKDMAWTTGDASGGTNGFGGTAATVGINRGNGIDYIQFGRFDHAGGSYDGPYGANDGIDFLDNTYFSLDACLSNPNVPPIANSNSGCDTIHVCVGDTFLLSANFLSPEPTQITRAVFIGNGLPGTTVLNNSTGNVANIVVSIAPGFPSVGYHTISLSGIDNGAPADTTNISIVVHVRSAGTATFSEPPGACPGDTVNVFYTGTGVAAAFYNWNFGNGTVISGSGSGPYSVQWNNGIKDTLSLIVTDADGCWDSTGSVFQVSQPIVLAPVHTDLKCYEDNSGTATVIISGGTAPFNYLWNTSLAQFNDSISNLPIGHYAVEVSDVNGCNAKDSLTIAQPPPLAISATFYDDTCGTSKGSAQCIVTGGTPPYIYHWSSGSTPASAVAINLPEGTHSVIVNDDNDCMIRTLGFVNGGPKAMADFDYDPKPVFFYSPKCTFTDNSKNAVKWYWDFADGDTSDLINPVHYFKKAGMMPVTHVVYNSFGCPDSIRKEVDVEGFYTFYLPTSFTPNGDGRNDIFIPFTTGVLPDNYNMTIFNRWGGIVFTSSDINLGWNGITAGNKLVSMGMYVYRFEFTDYLNIIHEKTGSITVTE